MEQYRMFWEESFDRLDAYLKTVTQRRMRKERNMAAKNKSNEIKITRVYDAPVEAVWDAWTDPEQVAQWWGPRGFTLTTHSKDLRPGGHWIYTMHGPGRHRLSQQDAISRSREAREAGLRPRRQRRSAAAVPRDRSVLRDGRQNQDGHDHGAADARGGRGNPQVHQEGGRRLTWDRLAEYLEKESSGKEQFVINRTFDAPLETMFEMWTNPKHFSKWLPPTGFDMEFIRADIRPGGSTFYFMTNHKDVKMYGTGRVSGN